MIADPAIGRPVDRRRRLFVLCDNGDVWVVPFPDLDRAGRECPTRPIAHRRRVTNRGCALSTVPWCGPVSKLSVAD